MRIIDADAFEEFIEKVYRPLCDDYHMKDYVLNQLLHDIENEKTVDAVPVIRCKDCKHWQCDDVETYCDELGIFGTDMSSYCSYAMRR